MTDVNHLTIDAVLEADIERLVLSALDEDIGTGDLTAQLVPESRSSRAYVISREEGVLCGSAWFNRCFSKLDESIRIDWKQKDGDHLSPDQVLCELQGPARSLLTGERTALNFLQLLSGVATKAKRYAEAVSGTNAMIVDTRKTLPGLRLAQKFAVKCGGGGNHRLGLYDAILVKENHIQAAGSITAAMKKAVQLTRTSATECKFIQVEVENLDELLEALENGAKMILLDNMDLSQMSEAVRITRGRAILEASGNVTLQTLRAIAETGVDRISIGTLTKDVRALDLSMRFIE
jgi:nicotinate-nucleotide pyrophosphorylase (carboxylating)